MQFRVPQFIDVKDKLFGPFTFTEFAFLVGGGSLSFIIYKILPLWIGIFFILPVVILTLLLVFYKINEQPFSFYLQAAFNYFISSKLYIWKQRLVKPGTKTEEPEAPPVISVVPMVSENKLRDISSSLDVQDKINQ
jgi:hypothetical protein